MNYGIYLEGGKIGETKKQELETSDFPTDKELIDGAKKQIAKEKPRCAICGRYFGIKEVMNDEVVSVQLQDNHFQNEGQWYEHKGCRND